MAASTIQSIAELGDVTCPACGAVSEAQRWTLLEATANPEVAARLRTGELLVHTCPKCKIQFPLDYPMMFVDRDARACAYYPAGTGDLAEIKRAFTQANINFKGINLSQLKRGEYAMRVVRERYDLVAKALAWHLGLDDEILQVMQQLLIEDLKERDGGADIEDCQLVGASEDGSKLTFAIFGAGDVTDVKHVGIPREFYLKLAGSASLRCVTDLHHTPLVDSAWADMVLAELRAGE